MCGHEAPAHREGQAAGAAVCSPGILGSQEGLPPTRSGTQEGSMHHGWAGAHCGEYVLITMVTGISLGCGPNLTLS